MAFLKFIGRLLIVTSLISSAYHHLENPASSVAEFKQNYSLADQLSNNILHYDIPYDQTNWQLIVKLFGVLELITIVLIVFGDSFGAILYFLNMLVEFVFHIAPLVLSGKYLSLSFTQQQNLLQYVGLLGVSLILIRSDKKQK